MCCVLDIIIVGNGKMGFSLADQLASEDHSITIVDTHEAALRRASDTLDVMSVKGNGVSAAVLREAGAEHADLLIAATSTDEVNMVCCLTAKKMGTSYTIARIRNQEYTSGLAELKRDLASTWSSIRRMPPLWRSPGCCASPPPPISRPSVGAGWS